jgi:hypothetical protein
MKASFRERNGLKPALRIQTENFDKKSREHFAELLYGFTINKNTEIEHCLQTLLIYRNGDYTTAEFKKLEIFHNFLGDAQYDHENFVLFFGDDSKIGWDYILEFCEIVFENDVITHDKFNYIFETVGWGYSMTEDGHILNIIDEIELDSINAISNLPHKYAKVKQEFSEALDLFSKRPEADYKSAVERASSVLDVLAKTISGNEKMIFSKWLGQQTRQSSKFNFPPSIRDNATKLYALNGDVASHGGNDDFIPDRAFALWYLINCSSMINWIIQQDS